MSECNPERYARNLSDACWDGYEAVGFKTKGGKRVPNCVPEPKKYAEKEVKSSDKSDKGGLTRKGAKRLGIRAGSETKSAAKKSGGFSKIKGKTAKRRESFCARSCGQKAKSSEKTKNDPDSRINKALRIWGCRCGARKKNARHSEDCPVKYARAEKKPKTHPSLRGYRLAFVLKDLSNAKKHGETISELAKSVLHGGDHGVLPILADALDEHGHPYAGLYNWRAAARGLKVDKHVRDYVQNESNRRNEESPSYELNDELAGMSDAHPEEIIGEFYRSLPGSWQGGAAPVDDVVKHVTDHVPGVTDSEVHESIRRLHFSDHPWLNRRYRELDPEGMRKDLKLLKNLSTSPPDKNLEFIGGQAGVKADDAQRFRGTKSPYSRKRYSRESRIHAAFAVGKRGAHKEYAEHLHSTGQYGAAHVVEGAVGGGFHHPMNMRAPERSAHAFTENGVPHVSITHRSLHNPRSGVTFVRAMPDDDMRAVVLKKLRSEGHTLSSDAKREIGYAAASRSKSADTTVDQNSETVVLKNTRRYARPNIPFVQAMKRATSQGQGKLHQIAREIAKSLKLDPAKTRDAIHDSDTMSFPGIAQAVYNYPDPDTLKYAAAWYGHLSQSPALAIFHVGEDGEDSIYKFRHKGSGAEIRKALDASGIKRRVMLPNKTGFDVLVLDRGRKLRGNVQNHALRHGLNVEESVGRAEVIGGPPDGPASGAKGRDHYRGVIREYEGGSKRYARGKKDAGDPVENDVVDVGTLQPHNPEHPGQSHDYFTDGTHFYKKPKQEWSKNQVFSEPAAYKALDAMGVKALPVTAVKGTDGETYLKSPLLSEFRTLKGTKPTDYNMADQKELQKLAIAEWVIHAADRNAGNHVITKDGEVLPIDYGESWHPKNAADSRMIGPRFSAYLYSDLKRHAPIDPDVVEGIIKAKKHVLKHAADGLAGLSESDQKVGLDLVKSKFAFLAKLLAHIKSKPKFPPTFGSLPEYNGLTRNGGIL